MGDIVIKTGAGLIIFYIIAPWVLTRVFMQYVYHKGKVPGCIAFTFDDGPDPSYTPKLLDLLKKQGIRASFFVVGSKAEQHPDIIRRIHEDGHLIGIHNYHHKSNWLMTPRGVKKQIEQTADIIENIIGERPIYYRPPWGILNGTDLFLLRKYKIVLWSVLTGDWSSKVGSAKITERLQSRVTDGSVILLHDCGSTFGADQDAPASMLEALEGVIDIMHARGLKGIRVDEMERLDEKKGPIKISIWRSMLVSLWLTWDNLFLSLIQVKPLNTDNPFLKYRLTTYSDKHPLVLDDGEQLQQGDPIIELHLDNRLLFELSRHSRSSIQLSIQLIRRMDELLPELLRLMLTQPAYREAKGLYGISILHRGPEQFGFSVRSLPQSLFATLTRWYLRLHLSIMHVKGRKRMHEKPEALVPKAIAMSKRTFVHRYMHRLESPFHDDKSRTAAASSLPHYSSPGQ